MAMQAAVETINNIALKINISVPAIEFQNAYNKRLNEVAKTAAVHGFRPGKVPVAYIKKNFGRSIELEVVDDLVKKSIDEVCVEKKLLVAGIENISFTQKEIGKDLEFSVSAELFPKIEFADSDFVNVAVTKFNVEVTQDDVNNSILKLRKSHASFQPSQAGTVAKIGDKVVIDFKGSRDGKALISATAKDFELELGSNHLIAGFEDGIVGHQVGDEFILNLTFPADYHVAEHAGKDTTFDIKLNQILYPKLPEVDDDFCKRVGVKPAATKEDKDQHDHDHSTCSNPEHDHSHTHDPSYSHGDEDEHVQDENLLDLLTQKIRKNLESEAKQRAQVKYQQDILDCLVAIKKIDIPNALIEEEIDVLMNEFLEKYRTYVGDKHAKLDLKRSSFSEQARNSVHLKLLVRAFIEQYKIQASREAMRTSLSKYLGSVPVDDYVLDYYSKDQNRLRQLEAITLESLLVDEIAKKIKVEDKLVSFDELSKYVKEP